MRRAQEEIELCAEAHHPENEERQGSDLVRLAPGKHGERQERECERNLVMYHSGGGQPEAPPAPGIRRTGLVAWPENEAHQKAHLVPAPQCDRAGEGHVGAIGARISRAGRQPDHRREADNGGAAKRPRMCSAWQPIQPKDRSGGEPPDKGCKQQRRGDFGKHHGLSCLLTRPEPCARRAARRARSRDA
jgi:hypothetical protein